MPIAAHPAVRRGSWIVVAWLTLLIVAPVSARELEPRAYRALPSGVNFLVLAYGYSSGNVVTDATSPIKGLEADIQIASASYLRSFGLAGRSASVTLSAPYVHMSASGTIDGEFLEGSRTDWADARARLTVNILGGPSLTPKEYAGFRQRRTIGVGLTVAGPTGQYSSSKLINFGANRWGFKPEFGYSSVRGKWILDAAAGVWLFTTNSDGFGGTTIKQNPITSVQGHLSYNLKGGMWLALDANYFGGGRISVDGVDAAELQENSRIGLTLSVPLHRPHSLKFSVATGARTRFGADFDNVTVAYQYFWGNS